MPETAAVWVCRRRQRLRRARLWSGRNRSAQRWRVVLLLMLLCYGPTASGWRQGAGRSVDAAVLGTVRDIGGEPVAGATVTLTSRRTGISRTVVTDERGRFLVSDLPTGEYVVIVGMAGFKEQQRYVTVSNGENAIKDIDLEVGALTESVEVASHDTAVPIRWNAWMETNPGGAFQPVRQLEPGRRYLLVIDVAALSYARHDLQVYSKQASNYLESTLRSWLAEYRDARRGHLNLLLVPDARFFQPLTDAERYKELEIDLDKVRALGGADLEGIDPFAELRQDAMPQFVFGRVSFSIETHEEEEGQASIALSIWGERHRPLDELALTFCVARASNSRKCAKSPVVAQSLRGIDSARVAHSEETTSSPDAALHFLQLGASVHGVFWTGSTGIDRYVTWPLGLSSSELTSRLGRILSDIGAARSAGSLRKPGEAMYDLLIPKKAKGARDEFQAFLAAMSQTRHSATSNARAPSIFVRMVGASGKASSIPLGLLRVTPLNKFVGEIAHLESPLPLQDYSPVATCIARWGAALPPVNTSDLNLKIARDRLDTNSHWWRPGRLFDDSPEAFLAWAEEPAEDPPTLLAVLSHHSQDRLNFGDSSHIYSESLSREFRNGVAVLAACGSSGSDPSISVAGRLNKNGMSAAIVTTVVVDPKLAADFLNTMAAVVGAGPTDGMALRDVYFETTSKLRDLSADGAAPYGELSLVFSLLGNGNVRLCRPSGPE
jgi:hypothetical protein